VPIIFHVERVRDGRSFATRTVQARQRGRCIFTATISFVRDDESTAGKRELRHAAPMPAGVRPPPDDWDDGQQARAGWNGPYQVSGMETLGADDDSVPPQERTCRQWIRARGKISAEGGHQAHVNALAYMSDSYFIGTVTRIHRVWRFPWPPRDVPSLPEETRRQIDRVHELEGTPETAEAWEGRPMLGMMVSLDHSIYFHEARRLQADEWMFTEMVSPWADDGRGLVTQRIFARDGTLLATCVQEVSAPPSRTQACIATADLGRSSQGVVRLKQDGDENAAKL
jgi:acyl-CoA thioesterase